MKSTYPNIHILMVSALTSLWFTTLGRMWEKWLPLSNTQFSVLLLFGIAFLFWMDDERMSELHNVPTAAKNKTTSEKKKIGQTTFNTPRTMMVGAKR